MENKKITKADLESGPWAAFDDWLDELFENDRFEVWSPMRQSAFAFMERKSVETFITTAILVNLVVIVVETDQTADGAAAEPWIEFFNSALLIVYSIELLIRMFIWRGQFLFDRWRLLDFFVVVIDFSFILISFGSNPPSVSMLRIFRLMKLARAIRALNLFPELKLLVASMIGAFMAMIWGMCLIFVAIAIWAIMAVQVLHPVNKQVAEAGFYEQAGCDRCPDAFRSVFASALTLWQTVVAGDSWGLLALPIIEKEPLTALFFVGSLLTIGMGIWNLILAVICEKAAEIRHKEFEANEELEKIEFQKTCEEFREKCKEMDTDLSGALSTEEVLEGFETNTEFARTMRKLGFSKNRVEVIMAAFDTDNSGNISYDEFASKLMEARGIYPSDDDWMKNLQHILLHVKVTVMEVQKEMKLLLNEFVIELQSPSGLDRLTSVIECQSVPAANKGDHELRDMLRLMTRKIEQVAQEMRLAADKLLPPVQPQLNVEAAAIHSQTFEVNGSINPPIGHTESKRAVAPAPQTPAATPQNRGLAKRLSSALIPSGLLGGRPDKE